jgi:hypothetical protein
MADQPDKQKQNPVTITMARPGDTPATLAENALKTSGLSQGVIAQAVDLIATDAPVVAGLVRDTNAKHNAKPVQDGNPDPAVKSTPSGDECGFIRVAVKDAKDPITGQPGSDGNSMNYTHVVEVTLDRNGNPLAVATTNDRQQVIGNIANLIPNHLDTVAAGPPTLEKTNSYTCNNGGTVFDSYQQSQRIPAGAAPAPAPAAAAPK